jgi:hypothetical protein
MNPIRKAYLKSKQFVKDHPVLVVTSVSFAAGYVMSRSIMINRWNEVWTPESYFLDVNEVSQERLLFGEGVVFDLRKLDFPDLIVFSVDALKKEIEEQATKK